MGIKNIEIAKQLNISTAAVSLARNNRPGVSATTRASVRRIVDEYNAAHPAESILPSDQELLFVVHKTHGQVIKDTPFFNEMMEAIQRVGLNASYTIPVVNYTQGEDSFSLLSLCNRETTKGILLLASEMNEDEFQLYKQIEKPLVVIDAHFPTAYVDCIGIDNEYLVRQGVRYAHKMGHRHIGFLASRVFTYNFLERLAAYRTAMNELELEIGEQDIAYLHCTANQAFEDMRRYLAACDPAELPTCFVAGNDLLAMGAIKALKEYQIRIPQDISIIGFDDMPIVAMMDPPLTSLHFNACDICQMAVHRLVQKIQGDTSCCRADIRGWLMPRDSVYDRTTAGGKRR